MNIWGLLPNLALVEYRTKWIRIMRGPGESQFCHTIIKVCVSFSCQRKFESIERIIFNKKFSSIKTSEMIWPHCVNRRRRNSILGRLLWHLNLTVKTLVYIIVHYSNRMFFRPSWLEQLNLWKFKLLIVKKNAYLFLNLVHCTWVTLSCFDSNFSIDLMMNCPAGVALFKWFS